VNAHIINCDETEFLNTFRPKGYLGVGIVVNGVTPQKLSNACRISYSMYSDMKTIRVGDIIFVHAGERIYGVFKAVTEFCERPKTPRLFLSKNIHYKAHPDKPGTGWKENVVARPSIGFYRRMAIAHFIDQEGENLCFENGFKATEVFELKQKKKIWSIPERWKYTDAKRTVRPLMENEAIELIKLLDRENADTTNRLHIKPARLSKYRRIQFILDPRIVENEKIVEGWILQNIGRHKDLDNALGPLTSFGNNIPASYLKFMDIFGYQSLKSGLKKYKVIEVKKDNCIFPDDINQLLGYTDWVVENIAEGDHKLVESIVMAKDFTQDCKAFAENFNSIARKMRLVKFEYVHPIYNHLNIIRMV